MDNRVMRVATVAAVAAGVAATAVAGTPTHLPSIALQSNVLFHLERLIALASAALLLVVVVARSWRGDLPVEVSTRGVRYAEFTVRELTEALDDVRARLEHLEERA